MLLPDLTTLQTIPGYATILKAVIKAQIQVLVEQLQDQAGEETIILTASIKEGTLCGLGSDRGKGFLNSRDDIKSQFLAYCQQDSTSVGQSQQVYPLYYRNFDTVAAQTLVSQPPANHGIPANTSTPSNHCNPVNTSILNNHSNPVNIVTTGIQSNLVNTGTTGNLSNLAASTSTPGNLCNNGNTSSPGNHGNLLNAGTPVHHGNPLNAGAPCNQSLHANAGTSGNDGNTTANINIPGNYCNPTSTSTPGNHITPANISTLSNHSEPTISSTPGNHSNKQLPSISLDWAGKQLPSTVSVEWAPTVAEPGVTVIKNSAKKFTILGDPGGATVLGTSQIPAGSVSLLHNRQGHPAAGILHSFVIDNGSQATLTDNQGVSAATVCSNSDLNDTRLESSFTLLQNAIVNPELTDVSGVSTFVTSPVSDKIVVNDAAKVASVSVDVKDKNKKTLSSKIDEITERILKDETQRVGSEESSLDQPVIDMAEIGSQLKVIGQSPDATSPSKFKDVSRASHRKPKQPRFNIGVASDDEDTEVTNGSTDTTATEDILNVRDLEVSMDATDAAAFATVNLDDLGVGMLLKENVTEIPIVEYSSNSDINKDPPISQTVPEITPITKPAKTRKLKRISHAIRVCGSNSEKKWFKCRLCPQMFPTQEMLNGHLETTVHTPKKCKCDFCGRTFGQLRDMERHRRIHTGEKPYTCDVCQRSFARKDNLKSHKVNHLRKQMKTQGIVT